MKREALLNKKEREILILQDKIASKESVSYFMSSLSISIIMKLNCY